MGDSENLLKICFAKILKTISENTKREESLSYSRNLVLAKMLEITIRAAS